MNKWPPSFRRQQRLNSDQGEKEHEFPLPHTTVLTRHGLDPRDEAVTQPDHLQIQPHIFSPVPDFQWSALRCAKTLKLA